MSDVQPCGETVGALLNEFETELHAIARWWVDNALDRDNGGLIGEIGVDNLPRPRADKGSIYHSRALWFFSALARYTGRAEHKDVAEHLYRYVNERFRDDEHGGVYWSLDWRGEPLDTRKHIYAQSFCIYGLCAYYTMSGDPQALAGAVDLFRRVEAHGRDTVRGGYHEGFSRTWVVLDDTRLSEKELNAPKTMNTHLHVLEACTALYAARQDADTREALRRVIGDFRDHIIDAENRHLRVFMDSDWRDLSPIYSYGHDIECSWLLWEALAALGDPALSESLRPAVTGLARACLEEGIGRRGELLDGYDLRAGVTVQQRPWWVQAEALVGFLNAWQMSGDERFYGAVLVTWSFIKQYQIDREHGEWHMHSRLDRADIRRDDYKAGFWKAPYHNGRAMMEVCSRLRGLLPADEM